MALAPWPLWQSNGTKNTSFQESSPESSPVQNPGPVQGIVLPLHISPFIPKCPELPYLAMWEWVWFDLLFSVLHLEIGKDSALRKD